MVNRIIRPELSLFPLPDPGMPDVTGGRRAKTATLRRTARAVRGIYEIPGRGYRGDRVEIVDRDHWVIRLDLTADEYYHNEPVKRALVRYPLKVVRWDVNPELNPFGGAGLLCRDAAAPGSRPGRCA